MACRRDTETERLESEFAWVTLPVLMRGLLHRAPLALRLSLGFAAIAAVGLTGLGVALSRLTEEVIEIDAKNLHLAVVDDIARASRDTAARNGRILAGMAQVLSDKSLSPEEQLRLVTALSRTAGGLRGVAVYDEQNQLIEVIDNPKQQSAYPFAATLGPQALPIAVMPCGDDKCFERRAPWVHGTLVIRSDASELEAKLAELSRRRFSSARDRVALMTDTGELIVGSGNIPKFESSEALFAQDASVSRITREEAVPVLRTYSAIPELRWLVAVDQPLQAALLLGKEVNQRIVLAVVSSLFVCLVAGAWFSRSQTKSLRLLKQAAEKVAAGDFSVRIDSIGADEVGELSDKFNDMVVQLAKVVKLQETVRRSETMAAMGQIVGGVAHEVRNPLFGISAGLDALDLELGEASPHLEYTKTIRLSVDRLTQLMNDLLDYGRPSQEVLVTTDLRGLVKDAVRLCEVEAQKAGVVVKSRDADQPMPLGVRRLRLTQVFQNLVQNAVQFSPRGSEVVVSLDFLKAPGAGAFVFVVRDQGPGLKDEDLAKLFTPFFSKRRGGTGLGLSIVKRIVEEHGGEISLRNHGSGSGTEAKVVLPLA